MYRNGRILDQKHVYAEVSLVNKGNGAMQRSKAYARSKVKGAKSKWLFFSGRKALAHYLKLSFHVILLNRLM